MPWNNSDALLRHPHKACSSVVELPEWPGQVADVLKRREARSMRISVNLTPSEFAQLQLLAEAEGRSMSNLSQQVIQAFLERQNCPG